MTHKVAFNASCPPAVVKRLIALGNTIRDYSDRDIGFKGGVKTTSFTFKGGNLCYRYWIGEGETLYQVDHVGSVYINVDGVSFFDIDLAAISAAEKMMAVAHCA